MAETVETNISLYSHVYFTDLNGIQNYLSFIRSLLEDMNFFDNDNLEFVDMQTRLIDYFENTQQQRYQLRKYLNAVDCS